MPPLRLAFLWHFHQPYYRDDLTGAIALPWVRLHAVKDYMGMGLLLERHPAIGATVNFAPSLLMQLDQRHEYPRHDRFYLIAAQPAEELAPADRAFLLRHFFSCSRARMIEPFPRYAELLAQRGDEHWDETRAVRRFAPRDLRDLQTWFHLAWFHPLLVERQPLVAELRRKGADFTEAEKQALLALQIEVMGEVVPLYLRLWERGQVELTCTPQYHPILPLLVNFENHRQAHPGAPLPAGWEPLVEDAAHQLDAGRRCFHAAFGHWPKGLWPAEGSVSADMVPLLRAAGVEWFAGDERVLARSLGLPLARDGLRRLRDPAPLYRPYRALAADGPAVLFRDQVLSDLLGFDYQHRNAEDAVSDFLARLDHARARCGAGAIAAVILDGENAWEHYPGLGVPFLEHLYGELERRAADFPCRRVSDALAEFGPAPVLPRLFAGSWINQDFQIWAGHEEDRRAWEALFTARRALVAAERGQGARGKGQGGESEPQASSLKPQASVLAPSSDADALARAWEELYIAEGSDWFWWYGDEHRSTQDAAFDALFRTHLRNIYRLVGEAPPALLEAPLFSREREAPAPGPRALLRRVTLDGRVSHYFEWLGAGCYEPKGAGQSMHQGGERIGAVWFGSDLESLYLRVDPAEGNGLLGPGEELLVQFAPQEAPQVRVTLDAGTPPGAVSSGSPGGSPSHLPGSAGNAPAASCQWHPAPPPGAAPDDLAAAYDQVLELRIAFRALGLAAGAPCAFTLVLRRDGAELARVPAHRPLSFAVPGPNAEWEDWYV